MALLEIVETSTLWRMDGQTNGWTGKAIVRWWLKAYCHFGTKAPVADVITYDTMVDMIRDNIWILIGDFVCANEGAHRGVHRKVAYRK